MFLEQAAGESDCLTVDSDIFAGLFTHDMDHACSGSGLPHAFNDAKALDCF